MRHAGADRVLRDHLRARHLGREGEAEEGGLGERPGPLGVPTAQPPRLKVAKPLFTLSFLI